MGMLNPMAIATDGCITQDQFPLDMATLGFTSSIVLVTIEVPSTGRAEGESFGYLITDENDKEEMARKLEQIRQDDEDIMLIINIFVTKWL